MKTYVDLPIYRIRESNGSFTVEKIRIELYIDIESRGSFFSREWFISKLEMFSTWKSKSINQHPNTSSNYEYWLELPMFFKSKDEAELFIKKQMYQGRTEKFHYVS